MKNYTDSDYALNKFSEGIVYKFSDRIVEVTLADYLAENPERTEQDFRELKKLSDAMYLDQVRKENAHTKKNDSLDASENISLYRTPSPEDMMFAAIEASEEAERRQLHIVTAKCALAKLTDVQRRRYLLYHEGLSTWKIADLEHVNQKSIFESLQAAEKKVKKILASS